MHCPRLRSARPPRVRWQPENMLVMVVHGVQHARLPLVTCTIHAVPRTCQVWHEQLQAAKDRLLEYAVVPQVECKCRFQRAYRVAAHSMPAALQTASCTGTHRNATKP